MQLLVFFVPAWQMTKECFGEEVALQQEKEAMQHAEYCARQAQGKDPAKSVAPIKQVSVPGVSRDELFPLIKPLGHVSSLAGLRKEPHATCSASSRCVDGDCFLFVPCAKNGPALYFFTVY